MRRISSDGESRPPFARPASGTQEESVETSAETFPLQIGAFHELRATLRPRTLPRRNPEIPRIAGTSSMERSYLNSESDFSEGSMARG
jgi:hypothetical protein